MTPCTLYLVRHGQTDWNVSKTIQGQTDIPLNTKGESQAHELRLVLKDIHFDAVFSSDLIRAKRTTEILNLERQLAIETTQALRERAFGIYEGQPMSGTHERLMDLLENYENHPHIAESHIESNEQMVSRALTFLREVSVAFAGKTILLTAHGGLMRVLLIHLGYCTRQQLPPFGGIQNLAYITLECDGVNFVVKATTGITIEK